MGCVYKITFPDGRAYIGATMDLDERVKKHVANVKYKPTLEISKAIKNYGSSAMVVSVLRCADTWDELYLSEKLCIIAFGTKWPEGLNLTEGGEHILGVVLRPENRENYRKKQTANWLIPGYRENMIAKAKGRRHSEDVRKNASEYLKLRWADPVFKAKMRAAHRNQWSKPKEVK